MSEHKDNQEKPDFSKSPKPMNPPKDPGSNNPKVPPQHQPPAPHK